MSPVMSQDILDRITLAEQYFGHSAKYRTQVRKAVECFERGDVEGAVQFIDSLPSETQLLETLTEKLKQKSVFKTLKKIAKGEETSPFEMMKGFFSLGTHICVECEQGNSEYTLLLDMIYHKLGSLIYEGVEQ